jgi:hypothetical protein
MLTEKVTQIITREKKPYMRRYSLLFTTPLFSGVYGNSAKWLALCHREKTHRGIQNPIPAFRRKPRERGAFSERQR